MRSRLLLTLICGMAFTTGTFGFQRGGERPDRPEKGGIIKLPPRAEPQCNSPAETIKYSCYDYERQIPWSEGTMHGCPENFVLTGGGNSNNVFYCTFIRKLSYTYELKGDARREAFESMACLEGDFVVGLREDRMALKCGHIEGLKAYGENPEALSLYPVTACPTTVPDTQVGVVTGWNTLKGHMLCSIVDLTK